MRWWLWIVVVLVAVPVGVAVFDRATRGRKLTNAPANALGNVVEPPDVLASRAAAALGRTVTVEAYALARMLNSEGSSDSALARQLRAWVAWNDARALGWDLVRLFTYSRDGSKAGRFGTQVGRRYSTARDPYEGDLADAERLLVEFATGADPTGGATKFTDGDLIPPAWIAEGYEAIRRPDARAGFTLFRRVA